jgi:hypothetical protein
MILIRIIYLKKTTNTTLDFKIVIEITFFTLIKMLR